MHLKSVEGTNDGHEFVGNKAKRVNHVRAY